MPSRFTEKLFLTVREACELSGLSRALLVRRIKSGELAALKDGSWKIRRSDIEKL
jgi:excisionase family DNA binding protein